MSYSNLKREALKSHKNNALIIRIKDLGNVIILISWLKQNILFKEKMLKVSYIVYYLYSSNSYFLKLTFYGNKCSFVS